MADPVKKKLIEVSLPLEKINAEASREKSIRHGHPSTLHLYWARRPLAAARAVLFAQLVDDPSAHPEKFPTIEEQDVERDRLHKLIEELVVWENSNNEKLLEQARQEIRNSNNGELPAVLDPFAGGGAIPLEAQRLGLEAHASDLNPLAVLINKALIEIPPKFKDMPPVFPGAAETRTEWKGAEGLAEDVRLYGEWMRDEAEKRIGHLYPKVKAPGGTEHTVIAWIWARTVTCSNPGCRAEIPLISDLNLGKRRGSESCLHPVVHNGRVDFTIRKGAAKPGGNKTGKKGAHFECWVCGSPITPDEVHFQIDQSNLANARLLATVAEGIRERIYLEPDALQESAAMRAADQATGIRQGETSLSATSRGTFGGNAQGRRYGFRQFHDYFTDRQLVTLTTLSSLIQGLRSQVIADMSKSAEDACTSLAQRAVEYSDAIATYLGFALSRTTNKSSSVCSWDRSNKMQAVRGVFARQAIPMVWDFAEANPFANSSGSFSKDLAWVSAVLLKLPASSPGIAEQADVMSRDYNGFAISTDPPYYDNIGYGDLSDYFYVWLRQSLQDTYPAIFSTVLTPKATELVANPYRHGGKSGAEKFFVEGFNSVFARMRDGAISDVPLTVYYAYKQQDTRDAGTTSTGWHTLLDGLMTSGWEITATWPMRTETANRMVASGTNALASSIVLACRPRPKGAQSTTRREFTRALKNELPDALRTMLQGSIAPVDLAQAAIGPGIAVFSRYSRVRNADGTDMGVREALMLINQVLDEVLGEQESDFDPETRFASRWFRSYGWNKESSGLADQLARSSDTSLGALERGGILQTGGGKARLLPPEEMSGEWNALTDDALSIWEATVRLVGVLQRDGADGAARTLFGVQQRVQLDAVKDLGFLLFHEAEKRSDSKTAGYFNALVTSWPDIVAMANDLAAQGPEAVQGAFDL